MTQKKLIMYCWLQPANNEMYKITRMSLEKEEFLDT